MGLVLALECRSPSGPNPDVLDPNAMLGLFGRQVPQKFSGPRIPRLRRRTLIESARLILQGGRLCPNGRRSLRRKSP